jgi:hypothetical protein
MRASTILLGLLLVGCQWGNGLREESANEFAGAPGWLSRQDAVDWVAEPRWLKRLVKVPPGRHIAASHWVGDSGLVVISAASRFEQQELFLVDPSGGMKLIPFPDSLASRVDRVHLVGDSDLALIDEAKPGLSFFGELRGIPFHGDLLLINFRGDVLARHRSGHAPVVSPDGRWMAYRRSNYDGLHNFFVTTLTEAKPRFVCAITEVDPGSGTSFRAQWSSDSRLLKIEGHIYPLKSITWIYDVPSLALYKISESSLGGARQP